MKKYTSEEAFNSRMVTLAAINKTSVNESSSRNLGTLVDFTRAANGVAYGIVQEEHKYYIKKGGLNENQDVADFAYIGGLGNVTDFEYKTFAEASKNRNMLLKTLNEGYVAPKATKKAILTEDKAGKEIDSAESKLGDLEVATDAAEVPAMDVAPEVPAMDVAPEVPTEEPVADEMPPADDMGGDLPPADDMGGDAMPALDGEEPVADEMPPEDGAVDAETGEMGSGEGEDESEATREIEKSLGKLTNTLRKTELTEPQVKSYVNSFLSAFKDDFPEIDIEERKKMAEKITKVFEPEDVEDELGKSVEDSEASDEITATEPELEVAEQQCAECGGFAQYAESRGYTADSIKECGDEEMTNLVSGYANGHGEGQNDGDFKAVALFITPEIIEKLKGDYGHDEYADQVEPFSTEMNEASAEDKDAQINELFGNIGAMMRGAGSKVGGDIKQGVKNVGTAIGDKASQVKTAVGDYATGVKQAAHGAVVPAEVKKLEGIAANLGQQIDALNKRMEKAGKEPVNVKSILRTIANQVAGASRSADLSGRVGEEEGIPVDSTEVMPPALEEEVVEEDVNITVTEKQGKKLSADNTPEVEMKEGEEKEGEDIDIVDLDVDAEEAPAEEPEGGDVEGIDIAPEGDDVLDLTKDREKPAAEFGVGFEPMGGGVVKPEGAEITTVEVTKDSVKVELGESEVKLRTYIRNRLQEHAGLKKASLNESEKSKTLQKLDRIIDKQFKLHEDVAVNEIFGMGVAEKLAKINPQDPAAIDQLFQQAFRNILINPKMGAIGRVAKNTPPEEKYKLLQQYVDGGGGSLRLADRDTIQYVGKEVKDAATHSRFRHGGTQGKTQLGGV